MLSEWSAQVRKLDLWKSLEEVSGGRQWVREKSCTSEQALMRNLSVYVDVSNTPHVMSATGHGRAVLAVVYVVGAVVIVSLYAMCAGSKTHRPQEPPMRTEAIKQAPPPAPSSQSAVVRLAVRMSLQRYDLSS